jgi:hypothetical protein
MQLSHMVHLTASMATKKTAAKRKAPAKKRAASKRATSRKTGEYVAEAMREEKKGRYKSPQQAIAVGLSKARRAGEDVPTPKKGQTSAATRKKAEQDRKSGAKKRAAKKKR